MTSPYGEVQYGAVFRDRIQVASTTFRKVLDSDVRAQEGTCAQKAQAPKGPLD